MSKTAPNNAVQSSLVLGTAQFGSHYGIANKIGQPNPDEVAKIVAAAWAVGIREFDTAQTYGDSEKVLGFALEKAGNSLQAKIISKLDPKLDPMSLPEILGSVCKSRQKLGVNVLHGILFHSEDVLAFGGHRLRSIAQGILQGGNANHIGVSVYSPQKALSAMEIDEISILQIPYNILDRRFERAGVFECAERKNVQLYIRSVFLQGLLLMDAHEIPERLRFVEPAIRKLEEFITRYGLDVKDLALGFVKGMIPKAKIIFGVDSPTQIEENIVSFGKEIPTPLIKTVRACFDSINGRILDPSKWPPASCNQNKTRLKTKG